MKRLNIFLICLLLLFSACSIQPVKEKSIDASWTKEAIAYEIFVQSFNDSNVDGIGDIVGMTQKLDYLQKLGIDAVWLMPIMASPSYHKYDVTDYKAIHSDYGTMEEFKNFVKEAHRRDIKIIVDFIINHTSSEHPWFINAKTGPDAKYRDYYVWANKDSVAEQIAKKETSFDSDNITQWHAVDGDTTAAHYYGFFYGGMPDLNFDNKAVRTEIYDIGKYWLTEVGVDGFRMDAAKHIFPDDRATDGHAFWAEFKSEMEKVKPDVYIVGEVWANTTIQAPFIKGFSSLFNFDLAFSILESVNREREVAATIAGHGWRVDSTDSFLASIILNDKIYKEVNSEYVDAIFLTNHDQNRAMSVLGNSVDKAKLSASIMMTLPGTPYIYYGEEIGMKGMKPDENIREPFLWNDKNSDKGRSKWMIPRYSNDSTIVNLTSQMKDPNSIYNHYQKLIELRKSEPTLTTGDLNIIENSNHKLLKFERSNESELTVVIHNLSSQSQSLRAINFSALVLGDDSWIKEDAITIPAFKTLIVKRIRN